MPIGASFDVVIPFFKLLIKKYGKGLCLDVETTNLVIKNLGEIERAVEKMLDERGT